MHKRRGKHQQWQQQHEQPYCSCRLSTSSAAAKIRGNTCRCKVSFVQVTKLPPVAALKKKRRKKVKLSSQTEHVSTYKSVFATANVHLATTEVWSCNSRVMATTANDTRNSDHCQDRTPPRRLIALRSTRGSVWRKQLLTAELRRPDNY